MVFSEGEKHLKFSSARIDLLQKESLYLDHRPCIFHSNSNTEKMIRKHNFYGKDSHANMHECPSLFTSKAYSNVSSSILSYVVGGFVGSKSQMNNNKKHNMSYDLSAVISNLLNPWKFEHENTSFKKNCDNLYGVPKIHTETYDKYTLNNKVDQREEKENNLLVNMMNIGCLFSIPVKNIENNCDSMFKTKNFEMKNNTMNNFQVPKTNNIGSVDNDKLSSTDNINSNNVLTNGFEEKCENFIKPEVNTNCLVTNNKITENTENLSNKLNFNCSEFDKLHNNYPTLNGLNCESIRNNVDENKKHSENFLTTERLRMQSECSVESTDSESFIVFDDSLDDGNLNKAYCVCKNDDYFDSENGSTDDDEDDSDDNEEDDDFVYDDDSEENGSGDEYDFCSVNINIIKANEKWSKHYDEVDDVENKTPKKVKFSNSVKINKIIAWDHAYRTARLGPWEQMARDRVRFQERISRLSAVISPILGEKHRRKILEKLHNSIESVEN